MKKKIITISREFGSGGRVIGEEIAKELNIRFLDKSIIEETAKKTGFAKEFIEKKGEYAPIDSIFGYGLLGRNAAGQSIEDILYDAQRQVVENAAKEGPCVIVGRNADYILKERDDCINVFICGNMEDKVSRICRLYQKNADEAKKMIHEVDKKRSVNYRYFTEQTWGAASNYTLCLNSSELGYETCKKIIKNLYLEG